MAPELALADSAIVNCPFVVVTEAGAELQAAVAEPVTKRAADIVCVLLSGAP